MRSALILAVVCAALVVGAVEARADTIYDNGEVTLTSNEYESSNSFTTTTGFSGWDSIGSVEAFLISTNGQGFFEYQGLHFDGSDGATVSGTYAQWSGSSDGTGSWNNFLSGDPSGTMVIDMLVYSPTGDFMYVGGSPYSLQGFSGRMTFIDGRLAGWSMFSGSHDLDQYNRTSAVPEPGTLALLGLGTFGLAAVRRGSGRRRRAAPAS